MERMEATGKEEEAEAEESEVEGTEAAEIEGGYLLIRSPSHFDQPSAVTTFLPDFIAFPRHCVDLSLAKQSADLESKESPPPAAPLSSPPSPPRSTRTSADLLSPSPEVHGADGVDGVNGVDGVVCPPSEEVVIDISGEFIGSISTTSTDAISPGTRTPLPPSALTTSELMRALQLAQTRARTAEESLRALEQAVRAAREREAGEARKAEESRREGGEAGDVQISARGKRQPVLSDFTAQEHKFQGWKQEVGELEEAAQWSSRCRDRDGDRCGDCDWERGREGGRGNNASGLQTGEAHSIVCVEEVCDNSRSDNVGRGQQGGASWSLNPCRAEHLGPLPKLLIHYSKPHSVPKSEPFFGLSSRQNRRLQQALLLSGAGSDGESEASAETLGAAGTSRTVLRSGERLGGRFSLYSAGRWPADVDELREGLRQAEELATWQQQGDAGEWRVRGEIPEWSIHLPPHASMRPTPAFSNSAPRSYAPHSLPPPQLLFPPAAPPLPSSHLTAHPPPEPPCLPCSPMLGHAHGAAPPALSPPSAPSAVSSPADSSVTAMPPTPHALAEDSLAVQGSVHFYSSALSASSSTHTFHSSLTNPSVSAQSPFSSASSSSLPCSAFTTRASFSESSSFSPLSASSQAPGISSSSLIPLHSHKSDQHQHPPFEAPLKVSQAQSPSSSSLIHPPPLHPRLSDQHQQASQAVSYQRLEFSHTAPDPRYKKSARGSYTRQHPSLVSNLLGALTRFVRRSLVLPRLLLRIHQSFLVPHILGYIFDQFCTRKACGLEGPLCEARGNVIGESGEFPSSDNDRESIRKYPINEEVEVFDDGDSWSTAWLVQVVLAMEEGG